MSMNATSYADITPDVYVIIVHNETGNGFALGQQYQLLHRVVLNAGEVVEVLKGLIGQRVEVTIERPNWLPSQDTQLPEWAKGIHAQEFTAYWLKHHDRLSVLRAQRAQWIKENCSADEPAPNWKWGLANSTDADELHGLEVQS